MSEPAPETQEGDAAVSRGQHVAMDAVVARSLRLLHAHGDAVVTERLERANLGQLLGDERLVASVERLAFRLPRLLLEPVVERIETEADPCEAARFAATLLELFVPDARRIAERAGRQ